jgi:predicted ATPase
MAGPNGAGKSNLFDAIAFLHFLTKHPIMEAVRLLRETKGRSPEPRSLFTRFGNYRAAEIRFTADLIVERDVLDDFGVPAQSSVTTLRYSVAFRLDAGNGAERLELTHESLERIIQQEARRSLGFPANKAFKDSCIKGRRAGTPFVSTTQGESGPVIQVHQEGHGGRRVPAPKSSRTTLGGMASSDFPTILAVHREMESWRTLLLEPSAMRAPSLYQDDRIISPRGANLPGAIYRLEQQEKTRGTAVAELANRLSSLIDGIRELRIRDDTRTETLTLEVQGVDGVFHPARSLSDGTLRFLVLATLALDPEVHGITCLEEPENGIHPTRIPAIVRLLRDISVDTDHPVDEDNPLRQMVINTHSPEVFQNCDPRSELVFIDEVSITQEGQEGRVAAVRAPEPSWRIECNDGTMPMARGRMGAYLGQAAPREQRQLWLDLYSKSR